MSGRPLPPLSPTELAARIPIWKALADLWLDTELMDFQLNSMAQVIAASPYSLEQVHTIHCKEVAPVLWPNLVHVAGEWAGFDEMWLVSKCVEQVSKNRSFVARVRNWLLLPIVGYFTAADWRQITCHVNRQQLAAQDRVR